jgi:hypothetical protein
MGGLVAYIKDIMDKDASPSFGRAGAAFVVYFLVVWECYIVSKTAAISDVPWGWVALIGLLWGGSISKEAYTKGKELISGNPTSN